MIAKNFSFLSQVVGMYLGMDVGCAPGVTAGEDGLKGGQTIDISHDQTPQEGELICLACSYPAGCCRPCTTHDLDLERKRKEKTTPFGVNLMRRQVLYWDVQVLDLDAVSGCTDVGSICMLVCRCC